MRQKAQRPRGGDPGVLLPERAGGSVARIGEQLLAARLLRGIQCGKVRFGHVNLAADFEDVGDRTASEALGNVANRPHIGGDILAHLAIAARRGAHQHALLVAQRERQSVDLVLGREREHVALGQRQIAPHACDELADVLIRKAVVEAHHPLLVPHLGERRGLDRCAHQPVGTVGADQMRKGRFQFVVPPHQRVIVRIRNLGRILGMIEPVVMRDLLGEPLQLDRGFGFGQGFDGWGVVQGCASRR